eukprot:11438157-Alexandrium_andersonii.AAC.1
MMLSTLRSMIRGREGPMMRMRLEPQGVVLRGPLMGSAGSEGANGASPLRRCSVLEGCPLTEASSRPYWPKFLASL